MRNLKSSRYCRRRRSAWYGCDDLSAFYFLAASAFAITALARSIAARSSSLCHVSTECPSSNERSCASCTREVSSRSAAMASASNLPSPRFRKDCVVSLSQSHHYRSLSSVATILLLLPGSSRERPESKFSVDAAETVATDSAPSFQKPSTSTEILDTADDAPSGIGAPVVDITSAFAERIGSWSSALLPTKSKQSAEQSERTATAPPEGGGTAIACFAGTVPIKGNPQVLDLFVRRIGTERPR
jgi:hypothetical protein